jgi:hypothetical protein
MTMMFDDTIKLYATPADDDQHYGDEAEDDNDDLRQRFGDDDEEEEVTMTSDDDEELDEDENGTPQGTHAEDATIFTLPPSPVTSYEPATKPSELPEEQRFDEHCETGQVSSQEGGCSGEEGYSG